MKNPNDTANFLKIIDKRKKRCIILLNNILLNILILFEIEKYST